MKMKAFLSRAILMCAAAAACTASHAGNLADAARAQSEIDNSAQSQAHLKQVSEQLHDEASKIAIEVMGRFYAQASKAGIKFDAVDLKPKPGSGDYTLWITEQSRDNGRFVVAYTGTSGPTPWVNIRGYGLTDAGVYFDEADGSNWKENGCSDLAAMSCICRLDALGEHSMPCTEFFDKSKRAGLEDKLVAFMNDGLVARLKQRAGNAAD
ncbi:hypothetical protein GCM10027093_08470 [Paraburkholderia jirisanensis]